MRARRSDRLFVCWFRGPCGPQAFAARISRGRGSNTSRRQDTYASPMIWPHFSRLRRPFCRRAVVRVASSFDCTTRLAPSPPHLCLLAFAASAAAGCSRPSATPSETCRLVCEQEQACLEGQEIGWSSTGETGGPQSCEDLCLGGSELLSGICRLAVVHAQQCLADLSCGDFVAWDEATSTAGYPCADEENAMFSICFGDDAAR